MNEALYKIIKERATREHRSIHAEILVVLENSLGKVNGSSLWGRRSRPEIEVRRMIEPGVKRERP